MSTKKCACFTPSGLVYTRLETDGTIARRPNQNITRSKRSLDNDVFEPNTVDTILEENPSIGHLTYKNLYDDELESRQINDKIDRLIKETEAFLEAYERTKDNIDHTRKKRRAQNWEHNKHKRRNEAVVNSNESTLECKIEKDGQVNCSQVIYNDLKAWHTNRLSLEDQIRQLRTKLEDLKEIKRHLKTTKPIPGAISVETQTVQNSFFNNNFDKNFTLPTHNTHKEHLRKNRVHRLKPKHRNITTLDKKLRHSNEFVLPTMNANTKDDVFEIQLKNITETSTKPINIGYNSDTLDVQTTNKIDYELPKPQVTTIIIENNYSESTERDKIDENTITTVDEDTTTELNGHIPVTKTNSHYQSTPATESSVTYFNRELDKVITNHRTKVDKYTEIKPTTVKPLTSTTDASSLGPARLDASEFEHRNPNRENSHNMGIFSKPVDFFQRRLHPLYIENEDKHVCYCEENR